MATGGFLFVMVVGNLFKGPLADVLGGRVPFSTFLTFCVLLIPSMAPYVLPIGILTGVLLVLGRMSAQNEITAMKASGMSLWRIVSPIIAIGIAGTLFAAFVNCEYTPRANDELKRLAVNSIRDNPVDFIAEKTPVTSFPGFLIHAEERDGETLRDVWIWRAGKLPDGRYGPETEFIRASRAVLVTDRGDESRDEDDVIRMNLENVVIERTESVAPGAALNPVKIVGAESMTLELPIGRLLSGHGTYNKKLRWHTMSELLTLREKGYEVGPDATPDERFADRIKVQMQIQSHLANAFGIISLTLIAIPLGIRVSRSETFVNFGVALALALTYYLLMVMISWIRNPYLRPDLLVWLPNIAIQLIAFRLLRKAAAS